MVSKAREDFPEPESPVITTNLFRGIWTSMFLRLCCRAPLMTISCASMTGPNLYQLFTFRNEAAGLFHRRRLGVKPKQRLGPRGTDQEPTAILKKIFEAV